MKLWRKQIDPKDFIIIILILRTASGVEVRFFFLICISIIFIILFKIDGAGIGGLADSFYEYLLKLWLYKNKSDKKLLKTYLDAINGVRDKLIRKSNNNFVYTGEYANNYLSPKMGHLACYTGGLFALTAMYVDDLSETEKLEYENLAKNITHTCRQSYVITKTHLGPESFSFYDNQGPVIGDRYYILRPEVIVSYFYLWRMTKNQKYRDWAWDAAMAIEKHCKAEAGYSGIRDVNTVPAEKDDVQQSFFFAETLKYLYLIFSDDNTVPLNEYVFNTEAHPFLIKKS
jgi:mannosyl-oligosaccharide alpha-1,2-mannosidase